MSRSFVRVVAAVICSVGLAVSSAACAGGDDEGGPMVDRIDDAIFAVESYYRAPQDFFEISATDGLVSVIVAVDATTAEQAFWSPDDGLVEPVVLGPMDRPTFRSGDLDFDPGTVLDRVREELPESEIVDFAVTGAGGGAVVYDARVQSGQGGVLLVLLAADGRILGAQGE